MESIARMSRLKLILICLLVSVLLIASINFTVAYFSSSESATNEFSVGGVTTEIVEDFEAPKDLSKVSEVRKLVRVKNTGDSPAYVRIFCEFSDASISTEFDPESGWATIDYNPSTFVNEDGETETVEKLWTDPDSDGWRYYTKILNPGESTTPIMSKVTIKDGTTESQLDDFEIIVVHESVQTKFTEGGSLKEIPESNYMEAWNNYLPDTVSN